MCRAAALQQHHKWPSRAHPSSHHHPWQSWKCPAQRRRREGHSSVAHASTSAGTNHSSKGCSVHASALPTPQPAMVRSPHMLQHSLPHTPASALQADPHQNFIVAGGGADAGHKLPLLRRGLHTISRRPRCSRVVLAAAGSSAVCSCAKSTRQQRPSGQQACRRQQGQCKQHALRNCCTLQLSSSLPCGPHRAAGRAAGCCCHWPLPAVRVAAAGWGRCPCRQAPSRWAAHWLLHCCCVPRRRA